MDGGAPTAWFPEEPATGSVATSAPSQPEYSTPLSDTTDVGFTTDDDELTALSMSMDIGAPLVDLDEHISSWADELPIVQLAEGEDPPTPTTACAEPVAGESIEPPENPPGEMFAAAFLREYCTSGGLISTGVWSVQASPARKWGLERELPAGWYLLDRASSGTDSAVTLPSFDVNTVGMCQWKVTGRQISEFDPQMPIQIRYCNPKDGCSQTYKPMRAAVYTFCTEAAPGEIIECDQRLIHVYLGRASRKKSTRRKAGGPNAVGPVKPQFKQGPAGAHRRTFNIQAPQSALQAHSNSLNTILKEVMDQLRAQNMDEAAAVVDAVMQKRFSAYRAPTAFSGSVLGQSMTKLLERTDVKMARLVIDSLKAQERESISHSLRRKLEALCTSAESNLDTLDKTVHVLFMSRDATDNLRMNRELQAIYDRVASTKGHPAAIPVVFTVVPNASAYTLWTTLTRARENFSHIHFSGHGSNVSGSTLLLAASPDRFDPLSQGSGEYQTDAPVNDRAFANAIAQYHNRLPANDAVKSVVLNACSTAEQGDALIDSGIPYVCVNDGEISDHVAVAFSSAFYEQIALGNGITAAHERAVNWVMLNVNERAYKLGGINGLRLLMRATSTLDSIADDKNVQDSVSASDHITQAGATRAAVRTTKEVAEQIRGDLGLSDQQCQTIKQLADAAVEELGISVVGSLRERLQAVAEELHISTGWATATDDDAKSTRPEATFGQGSCDPKAWLRPWEYCTDCPKVRGEIAILVSEHGADPVRRAVEKTWLQMEQRRKQMCPTEMKNCTGSSCMLKFMTVLKGSLSSSLQPCGQASSLCDSSVWGGFGSSVWGGRKPSDEEFPVVKRLVDEMDFDPVAATMAVRETDGRGLQPAVEWLLQNLDSLTSASRALLESAAMADSAPDGSPAHAREPAPEPEVAVADARHAETSVSTQRDPSRVMDHIKQILQTLGFDDFVVQTVVLEIKVRLVGLKHAKLDEHADQGDIQAIMQEAVRMAFLVQLSEETPHASHVADDESNARNVLDSLSSGSSNGEEALSPRTP